MCPADSGLLDLTATDRWLTRRRLGYDIKLCRLVVLPITGPGPAAGAATAAHWTSVVIMPGLHSVISFDTSPGAVHAESMDLVRACMKQYAARIFGGPPAGGMLE